MFLEFIILTYNNKKKKNEEKFEEKIILDCIISGNIQKFIIFKLKVVFFLNRTF